jgi:signal transduction histidine kinase
VSVYTDYIINDIGMPPDRERTMELARLTMVQVAVKGPSLEWSTADRRIHIPPDRTFRYYKEARFTWHRGNFIYIKERDGYRYTFFSSLVPRQGELAHVVILLVLVTLVSATAYLLIRRILRPVKLLSWGVKEVAAGNLDHNVPVKGRDELGELTESFNSMKNRVKEMLHARDQLLVDVSHELRSPLTRMKVALEFIEDEKVRENIGEDIDGLEKMITEVLETERLKHLNGKLDTAEFDIIRLIREVSNEPGTSGRDISIDCPDTPVMINADRDLVRTVIRNVLENATKYSGAGEQRIEITCEMADDAVTIMMRDHGEGIPPEELPYLFEPFYRADESRSRKTGGYGLGLSLCKKIMEAHDGFITIDSREGEGTMVSLRFPRLARQ